jgi:hypothetical protein
MKITTQTKILILFTLFSHSVLGQDLGSLSKEKPVQLHGSIGLGSAYYGASGVQNRQQPLSWYLSGSPTLSLYGIACPFSLTISEQQRNFSQPFNQYGVSPYYKWVTLHAGYRNVQFSEFTLAGANFLGGGIEMNPKKFRFGFIAGQFRRAVEEDTTQQFAVLPSYRRTGFAVKIGVGSVANYVDFVYFKGKDDTTSLRGKPKNALVLPGDNVALGIKTGWRLGKHIALDGDVGVSLLTNDLTANKLDIDATSPYFKYYDFGTKFITPNISTRYSIGGRGGLTYFNRVFKLALSYRYIQPNYESFGAYYFQQDIQQITAAPAFTLLKGKINFGGSYGIQNDNVLKIKAFTTTRNIGSFNFAYNPSRQFGFGINYSNFGTSQESGRIQLNDSVRISFVNQTYGGNVRFMQTSAERTSLVMLMGNVMGLTDRNEFTQRLAKVNTFVGGLNYSLTFNKKGTSLNAGINYTNAKNATVTSGGVGATIGANKRFSDKFDGNVNAAYQVRQLNGASDGNVTNVGVGFSYTPVKQMTFGLNGNLMFNTSSRVSSYSYNEQRVSMRYNYNF